MYWLDVIRVINSILSILCMPILAYRLSKSRDTATTLFLVAFGLWLVAVGVGSYQHVRSTVNQFTIAPILILAGLILSLIGAYWATFKRDRN